MCSCLIFMFRYRNLSVSYNLFAEFVTSAENLLYGVRFVAVFRLDLHYRLCGIRVECRTDFGRKLFDAERNQIVVILSYEFFDAVSRLIVEGHFKRPIQTVAYREDFRYRIQLAVGVSVPYVRRATFSDVFAIRARSQVIVFGLLDLFAKFFVLVEKFFDTLFGGLFVGRFFFVFDFSRLSRFLFGSYFFAFVIFS